MIVNLRNTDNGIVFDIFKYEQYEDFDAIVKILELNYQVTVREKLKGPGTSIYKIEINGAIVSLVNNCYGNFLKPENSFGDDFIKSELKNLNEIFSIDSIK